MLVIKKSIPGKPGLSDVRPNIYIVAVDSPERDVGDIAVQLQEVLDLPKKKRPEIVVMSFDGYDDDPREIDSIPEVQAWCHRFLNSVTNSTLSALSDERVQVADHFRSSLIGGVGLCRFVAIAGYGERRGSSLLINNEGLMVLDAITGNFSGDA